MRNSSLTAIFVAMIAFHCNFANAQDGKWTIRAIPSYFATASGESPVVTVQPAPLGTESMSLSVDGDAGIGLGFEYRWNDRISLEGAAFLSSHETQMVITNDLGTFIANDSTRFRTFTFGANYHFTSNDTVQWSVGGFVPLVFADGTDHVFLGLTRTESRAYDQDYGVGVKGAMNWPFSRDGHWSLSVEGRYMYLLTMESETVGDVDIDPFVLSVGVGDRF